MGCNDVDEKTKLSGLLDDICGNYHLTKVAFLCPQAKVGYLNFLVYLK